MAAISAPHRFSKALLAFVAVVLALLVGPTQAFCEEHENRAVFLDHEYDVAKARAGIIRGETIEVLASYFLLDGTRAGAAFLAELRQAARNGVSAKLVIDGLRYGQWDSRGLERGMLKHLIEEGVQIRVFNPIDLTSPLTYLRPSNTVRNHEKLLIGTGQRILETGDRNMQNINFRMKLSRGMKGLSYRSTALYVQGPVVEQAREHFYQDIWNSPWTKPVDLSNVSEIEIERGKRKLDFHLKISSQIPGTSEQLVAQMQPVHKVQFSYDFPSPLKSGAKVAGLDDDLLELVKSAQKKLLVISPYIRFTSRFKEVVFEKLKTIKDFKLTIIIPSETTTDAAITLRAFAPQARKLVRAGANIRVHQGPDFLHAKAILVDGHKLYIGSHNISNRSWRTDYESGTIVEDRALGATFESFAEQMIVKETQPYDTKISLTRRCTELLLGGALSIRPLNNQL